MFANLTFVIETLHAIISLDTTIKTQRATSSMTRRIIASTITPRKRAMWLCTMTSPLCGAWENFPDEGVILVQDLLRALVLVLSLALARAAGATTTTMWLKLKMTTGQLRPSSADTRTMHLTKIQQLTSPHGEADVWGLEGV
jgi:hypothetical protein